MFFWSKALWLLLAPGSLVTLLVVGGGLLWRCGEVRGWPWGARWGRRLAFVGGFALLLIWASPLPVWVLRPLEQRFPPFEAESAESKGEAPAGIIVLGGSFDPVLSEALGHPALIQAPERMSEFLALARRYPAAKLVFTGGSGRLLSPGPNEAEWARRYLITQGLSPERVIFEDQARNTRENAIFSRERVHPVAGERWILITSASHMPRSVAVFRAAGWPGLIPDPVDYRTQRRDLWWPHMEMVWQLRSLSLAIREWEGLVAYRFAGYTQEIWPAP